MTNLPPRPAAFLDRDGTLIVEHGFLSDPAGVEPLPGAVEAVKTLNDLGFLVIGITNQSGVARGYFGEDVVRAVNLRVIEVFAARGARVNRIYYCPHYPIPGSHACECRKPARGMIDRAAADLGLDPARSFVVGDKWLDVNLGHAVGARSILVRTGWGSEQERRRPEGQQVEAICDNLIHAVSVIISSDHAQSS